MHHRETIFALATAPGKSGVAIIRISGPRALATLVTLTGKSDWKPNIARFTSFSPATSHQPPATIDKGLGLYFKAPASFTGEDVVELHIHGSLAIIREMLEVLSAMEGLRPAEPGEFTRRAFLNGKMDLVEAEGLADLIDAETILQKRQAQRQMDGALSRHFEELRTRIIRTLAHLEAYIDFPEEDIPESVITGLSADVGATADIIRMALDDDHRGERVREGVRVVILGAPNAGKSSLLNALAKRDAAIVSAKAGTTRDVIEVHMDISGFPVILTDTAGLRDTSDDIEEEGVRRALARAGQADIKLVLFDVNEPQDTASLDLVDNDSIVITTKMDSRPEGGRAGISISTHTGQGLDTLITAMEQKIAASFTSDTAPLITRSRHRALLTEALGHLERLDFTAPLELTCEELRRAAVSIGKITGKIAVDDVLDVIFKSFCIGK